MDAASIKEARALLKSLVFKGEAVLSGGRRLQPDDGQLIAILEKVATRKLEEKEEPVSVHGFQPQITHHTRPKDPDDETES